MRQAELALARLIVQLEDIRRNGGVPTDLAPGQPPASVPGPPVRVTYPDIPSALDDFMTYVKSESSEATYEWYQEKLWPLYERFNEWPVNKLTYQEGVKYKTWLRSEKEWRKGKHGPPRKGLANTTVNHHL